MKNRTYIAIDLKSFYASVECVERGLDPLKTCLVVADLSRTNKTICLAISPALKAFGIPGRPRLFEVEQLVKEVNKKRSFKAKAGKMTGKSYDYDELIRNPSLEVDYIVAVPRMQHYIECSDKVYETYLKYVSSEDVHIYSIDEVFIDVTDYLNTYRMSAHMLALTMIKDVLSNTGVTATAGIGTNMYLAKVAMDIVAKHMEADKDGVRIAELDEMSYRKILWSHTPITDFWRVGKGYARRLAKYNLFTMGDIARFSLKNEAILYKEFGINAELLIDHAWGYEPCRMEHIKNYQSDNHSLGSGQVLMRPYSYEEALTVVKEMADGLALELHSAGYVTDMVGCSIAYDTTNNLENYEGVIVADYTGRKTVAKPTGGTLRLGRYTSSSSVMRKAIVSIYEATAHRDLTVRRINVVALNIIPRAVAQKKRKVEQFNLFEDAETVMKENEKLEKEEDRDGRLQDALLNIKKRFGSNAVLKGVNYEDAATARERNNQIGGHRK